VTPRPPLNIIVYIGVDSYIHTQWLRTRPFWTRESSPFAVLRPTFPSFVWAPGCLIGPLAREKSLSPHKNYHKSFALSSLFSRESHCIRQARSYKSIVVVSGVVKTLGDDMERTKGPGGMSSSHPKTLTPGSNFCRGSSPASCLRQGRVWQGSASNGF
jgi:hypothetical protein